MTERKKRFHPAPAGRVMATGISVSATLGIMAVLAANQPVWSTSTVAAGSAGTGQGDTTATTVITDHVPRTIVLQPGQAPPPAGAPTDASGAPTGTAAAASPAAGDQGTTTYAGDSGAGSSGGGSVAAPVDSGGSAAAPAPTPAPEPVVTSPPVTSPPTTTAPPPTCAGSQC
ncbi:MAG: hypothetical protein U0W40_01000 [Acidimicrobiia bacterium]